jgi:hypothetical protein
VVQLPIGIRGVGIVLGILVEAFLQVDDLCLEIEKILSAKILELLEYEKMAIGVAIPHEMCKFGVAFHGILI